MEKASLGMRTEAAHHSVAPEVVLLLHAWVSPVEKLIRINRRNNNNKISRLPSSEKQAANMAAVLLLRNSGAPVEPEHLQLKE